jgi:hypothetical protein
MHRWLPGVHELLLLLGTHSPAWQLVPAWQGTSTYPVPLGAHTWLIPASLHRVLSGAQTMEAHVPPAQTCSEAHGEELKPVPEVLQTPVVMESRHRVCPGVHTVATQRPDTQASVEEQGAAVNAVPVELHTSCTPLTGLHRSENGTHTGALQALVAESQPVEQNWRNAHALPVGVQASIASLLHRFSPGVQMEAPEVEQVPLAQPRSQVCTTSYPEPSGRQASTVLLSAWHRVVFGVQARATQAPLLHRPAQLSLNS